MRHFCKAEEVKDEIIAAVLVITSDDEDEEGKLTIYIDEYMTWGNSIGRELFKYDGEAVEVSGVFLEEDDRTIFFRVKSYKIIASNGEEIIEEDSNEDELEESHNN